MFTLVAVHPHTFIVLHGYFFLGKTSGPLSKAAGSGFYSRWYYVRPGVDVSTRRIGLAMK